MRNRVLVVGSSGQLGQALCHQLGARALPAARSPKDTGTTALDLECLSATPSLATELIAATNPDAVICAAGATDVERCESDHGWAAAANHLGPLALAEAARDVPFVFLSTDYVFDGAEGPYSEEDEPRALSIYGQTKLDGEQAILGAHPNALVLRTTTVYGPDPQRKNFLYTLSRVLQGGGTMRCPTDQLATPTHVEDLATATLALLEQGTTGVVHVAGPQFYSRYDFALEACEILGLDTRNLVALTTPELQQKAARPLLGGLRIDKLNHLLGRGVMRSPAEGIRAWHASLSL